MRILVTGSLGFIGSHFCRLYKDKYQIIGLDKGEDSKNYNRLHGQNIRLINKDLSKDAYGVLEGIDVVINFAAETFVDLSIKNPRKFLESNVVATFNLLEEARKYPLKKFIQISTDEVYGSKEVFFSKETDMLIPGNPYSASKAACDMNCLAYKNTYNLPIYILRPENNYGPYQHTRNALPTWIRCALNNLDLPVYEEGLEKRRWLNVEDFCSFIESFINSDPVYTIYNVGRGEEYSNIDVVNKILEILQRPRSLLKFIPNKQARLGHDFRYAMNLRRMNEISWRPKHTLVKSLPKLIEWHIKNPGWFK